MSATTSPLQPIIVANQGRVAQLELGAGNNQQARASDVNPIIAMLNGLSGVNSIVATSAGNTQTINATSGKFTTATLTTGVTGGTGSPVTALTITDNLVTSSSMIIASIQSYAGSTGQPVIIRAVPSAGSFVLTVANVGVAVLNGAIVVKFIVL